ncbi:hypothetical protein [Priestia megaterium]|uniref:hypothetical protein n=1 Tax=Priestia megaterium TaxID=1404 RepID=UPI00211D6C24|nr:hypothetical protein [Priestia megaterium]
MKKEYFVQYSDQSIINSFDFPKDKFISITVGISDITPELIISLVQNMFGLPVFFVLDSMLSGYGKETLIKNKIPFYEHSSDDAIIKVDSVEKLDLVSGLAEVLVNNGLSVFIFHGEGILEQDLIPSRQWNKPIEFKNVDIQYIKSIHLWMFMRLDLQYSVRVFYLTRLEKSKTIYLVITHLILIAAIFNIFRLKGGIIH